MLYKFCCLHVPDDCVMSEWSTFSPCQCDRLHPSKTRTRVILQVASPNGQQCDHLNETLSCSCPTYQLVIGRWTDCVVESSNQDCGAGERLLGPRFIHF